MKVLRLSLLLLTCSTFSFAVNKDLIALQRDLEAKMDAMQQQLNSKIDVLTGALQAMQADTRRTADQVAGMQDAITNGVARSLAPVTGLNTRVETVGEDVRSLKDALNDLSARLERMDAKITDLKNQIQIIQSPPPAPANPTSGVVPGSALTPGQQVGQSPASAGPPPGMSAEKTYTDARRDLQTGNTDLAFQEFQQYLTYFPNTELAANAQYYIGEISYNRGDLNGAIQAFDAVLERYPENPKTADAHYMKALALLKANQRSKAVQEFRVLVDKYPRTDDARKAQQQLRSLGVTSSSPAPVRRRP